MSQLTLGALGPNLSSVSVIMAGGSGTRFWPLSRRAFPKQYLPLGGGTESLLQSTSARMEQLSGAHGIMVVTAEQQAPVVRDQLSNATVLIEPCARNTAPCIAYAAMYTLQTAGDIPMVCVPADHLIFGLEEVVEVFRRGAAIAAAEDKLVTFGIKPRFPETGYGYIRCGDKREEGVFEVLEFVEKPSRTVAERYLQSGQYFWNSGMFAWRPSVVLREVERHLPQLAEALEQIKGAMDAPDAYEKVSEIYQRIAPVSVDVGIMERADNVLMIVGDTFEWSDVGSWSSWADSQSERADALGNVSRGEVVLVDSRGCAVFGSKKLIAAVGVENLIIVESDDAILVCHRERSQDVKKVVEELAAHNRTELL